MNQLKCQQCGSPDLEFLPGNYCRCKSCGTAFQEPHAAHGQPVPQYYVPPPPPPPQGYPEQKNQGAPVVLVASLVTVVVLVILGAGAVFFLAAGRSSSSYSPTPYATPSSSSSSTPAEPINVEKPIVVDAPKEPKVSAEFTDISSKKTNNSATWVGRYLNTGEAVITSGIVSLTLLDEAGKRVGQYQGYTQMDWLEPGEFTVVYVFVSELPKYAREEFKVNQPVAASTYSTKPLKIAVTEQSTQKSGFGGVDVIGTVKNTHSGAVGYPKLMVYGFNEAGKPVSVANGYAADTELAPGATSTFSISANTFAVDKVARYQLIATARPK